MGCPTLVQNTPVREPLCNHCATKITLFHDGLSDRGSCGPWSRSVILRDTGCGPNRQSKADALARVAATRGRGASKEQQALACLGRQAERPRFQDGISEGMLGHSRNPSPTSSTRDLPCGSSRRVPNRWHPRVSRRRPYPLRNPPHEGSTRILLENSRQL